MEAHRSARFAAIAEKIATPPSPLASAAGDGWTARHARGEGHKHPPPASIEERRPPSRTSTPAASSPSAITRTSLGPSARGQRSGALVTKDAATIVNELEVQHPAAKILVIAQQEEIGDGTSPYLLLDGLHPSEIVIGYTKAINKTIEILKDLVEKGSENIDVRNKEESLHNSSVHWLVLKNDTVGRIKRVEKAKLENYAKTEEAKLEELIKAVADSGAKVIVSGSAVGDMALHFCEQLKLNQPNADELGYADSVSVEDIGGVRVTVLKNEEGGNSVAIAVLRGNTDSILDDLGRAVDDGVNTYKSMCRDSQIIPGTAATEIELAKRLKEFSLKLDHYAIAKFAESFEMVTRTLAENAWLSAMEIISSRYTKHAGRNTKAGIDLEEGACKDVSMMKIWDLYVTKCCMYRSTGWPACR
uniref:CCT-theta n=1 Tax=Oryza punctata TaxID=4537 RepID=A0A0E0MGJ8_ORYPU